MTWQTESNTDLIVRLHNEQGGCTVNHSGDLAGTDAWAVAVHPDRELRIPGRIITAEQVFNFSVDNSDLWGSNFTIGTWYDVTTDESVLDIIVLIQDTAQAIAVAKLYKQDCIYHLKQKRYLYTNTEQATALVLAACAPLARPKAETFDEYVARICQAAGKEAAR